MNYRCVVRYCVFSCNSTGVRSVNILVWPPLFFYKQLNLVVNKQFQWNIKIVFVFRSFKNWWSKIGPTYLKVTKYKSKLSIQISNTSWSPFFIIFNEKNIRRIPPIFDIEKWLWKSDIGLFSTFNSKTTERPKTFLWLFL